MSKVYEIVTDKIISLLEQGVIPWHKPWDVTMPMNLVSKKPYRGINTLLLSHMGYKSPYWLTFNQAKRLGGHIKKNSKGMPVVFWNMIQGKDDSEGEKTVPLLRYHTIFNSEQCENIPVPEIDKREFNPIEECERVVENMPNRPTIEYGGKRACYIPSMDVVQMPHKESFESPEHYYSVLDHELIHACGAEKRLNRKSIAEISHFGSEQYGIEELIAQIGSSYLCCLTGIENQTIDNSAAYIATWLDKIRKDRRMILVASGKAQQSVDYILNTLGQENHEN